MVMSETVGGLGFSYAFTGGARGRLGAPSERHVGSSGRTVGSRRALDAVTGRGAASGVGARTPLTNWHNAQLSSWCTRGHFGVLWSSMCGLRAADATFPASSASITLMMPGSIACAKAAMKIQPRTNVETRLTTKSFPVVGKVVEGKCNRPGAKTQIVDRARPASFQHSDKLVRGLPNHC
jgi:hypothetical protein